MKEGKHGVMKQVGAHRDIAPTMCPSSSAKENNSWAGSSLSFGLAG